MLSPSNLIKVGNSWLALGALLLHPLTAGDLTLKYTSELKNGSAIITSRSGNAEITGKNHQQVLIRVREDFDPAGLDLETKENGHLFLTLSNGVAIGMNPTTKITCVEYLQRPFDSHEQALGLEPSISKLRLHVASGEIAIACNYLSPLSELRITIPEGGIRLHKGTCFIRIDENGLYITAREGNLTYYYPDQKTREFISAPTGRRLSAQSIARQTVANHFTVADLRPTEEKLCRATRHASRRVIFQPNKNTDAPPKAFMVVRPDYFKQPPFRPYQFLD